MQPEFGERKEELESDNEGVGDVSIEYLPRTLDVVVPGAGSWYFPTGTGLILRAGV